MHFDYSKYQGTDFFKQWWGVISGTFSLTEKIMVYLFLAVLLFYLIFGKKRERTLFLSTSAILTILVLNPWSAWFIYQKLGIAFAMRVFRYFWLYPIYMVLAYFVTQMVFLVKGKARIIVMAVFIAGGTVLGAMQVKAGHYFTFGGHTEFKMIENVYKVSNDVVDVCNIIDKDKNDKHKAAYTIYDHNMFMEIRTYDGSIVAAHGAVYGNTIPINDKATLNVYVSSGNWVSILASMVSTNNTRGIISEDIVVQALQNVNADYIIIKSSSYNVSVLEGVGLINLGTSKSGEYTVLKVVKDQLHTNSDEWQTRLYGPDMINYIDGLYFINDVWNHRIIYNDNLDDSIELWSTIPVDIKNGHTISSDGELYICDETDTNSLHVFKKTDEGFVQTQVYENMCNMPCFTYYDENTHLFYVMADYNGELFVFKNNNGRLDCIDHRTFDGIVNGYTRTFSIIDGYMYILGDRIYKLDYTNDYSLVDSYDVPEAVQGMSGISKIGDYYYISIYANKDFVSNPHVIRTKDLTSLADGGFEDVYGNLGITGTPFFISEIDGVYYVPFQGESNGIVTFELSDNGEITDINMLYEFDEVVQSSLDRYYSKY